MNRAVFCKFGLRNQIGQQSFCLQRTRQQSEFVSKNSKNDIQMPTPLSLGFDIKYQRASVGNPKRRTCAVVAGWMGAKENQMQKCMY
jgi:uncharacterized protein (DUF2237 family)